MTKNEQVFPLRGSIIACRTSIETARSNARSLKTLPAEEHPDWLPEVEALLFAALVAVTDARDRLPRPSI